MYRAQHRSLLFVPFRGPHRPSRCARGHSLALITLLSLSVVLTSGCSGDGGRQEVVVSGSTTLLPIAEVAGEMYGESHPGVSILVSGMGSSAGIESVSTGSSDIGTSSRELKEAEYELGLADTPVAYDAIAVIVHPDNPVRELTTLEIRSIFAGVITNWSELGGPDLEIGLVNRDEASGTREAFSKIVMGDARFDLGAVILPGTGQVRAVVSDIPGAVGYISLGFVNDDVRAVAVDGIEPSEAAVVAGDYPIQRVLHFFTHGEVSESTVAYIEYVLSPAVQDSVVRDAGFIPITAKEVHGG
ncbi:MAG: phosphate ABC transporter substrate-binding protein [Coriobacteriia bacterium]|nr:phosphate ABC transporter substrate-binding protein [Coriobacteriia bacterium]